MHGVQHLAINVELALIHRGVADSHWAGLLITFEPRQLTLWQLLSSTLRILSGEAEGFGESIPKFDGNFHAVWALPGH